MSIGSTIGFCQEAFGIEIIVRKPHIIWTQIRTHRKKRINKKWWKRYGMQATVEPYDPREILQIGQHTLVCYPEMERQVRDALQMWANAWHVTPACAIL